MPEAKYHLGAVLIALGRPEEAVVPLQQAAAVMPGYEAHALQLGRAYSLLQSGLQTKRSPSFTRQLRWN